MKLSQNEWLIMERHGKTINMDDLKLWQLCTAMNADAKSRLRTVRPTTFSWPQQKLLAVRQQVLKALFIQMVWSEDCNKLNFSFWCCIEKKEIRKDLRRPKGTPGTSGSQHHCRVHPLWSNSSWRNLGASALSTERNSGTQAQHHQVKKCCGIAYWNT